jgi:hypothetical protein
MKLSRLLQSMHDSGDVGQCLEGLAEKAETLESFKRKYKKLKALADKHGICEKCGDMYQHALTEPFASCACNQAEWTELTPYMKLQVQSVERCADVAKKCELILVNTLTFRKEIIGFQSMHIDKNVYEFKLEVSQKLHDYTNKVVEGKL